MILHAKTCSCCHNYTSLLVPIGDIPLDVSADDLAQGVKKLREQKFDLLLVDLNLPEVRGEAGIKLFRQRLKLATPIIVLSGEIKVQTVLDMKPLDVSAFVAKGEDFEEKLIEEVTRILVEKGRIHGRLG